MSSNPPPNSPAPAPSDYHDDREQRRADREARREARREMRGTNGAWIGGAVLIAVGVIFLLQNAGIPTLNNWWALFILIPAVGSLATAWNIYRRTGQFTSAMIGSVGVGIVLVLVAVGFLFELNMSLIFPVGLILVGLGALATALVRQH